jgi:multiple sugar transport system substrate-binding protein
MTMCLLVSGCVSPPENSVVELTFITGFDASGTNEHLIRTFNERHPGIRVRLQVMPMSSDTQHNQYATYLISEDSSIDVYTLDVVWPAEFGSAGWALPLDDFLPPGEREKFLPGPLAACTLEGRLYAVPWYTDAGMLYYRKDLLAKYGFKPPGTWDELVRQAKVIGEREKISGFLYQAAQYEGLVCNFFEHVWGNGGDCFTGDNTVVIDRRPAVEALQLMRDLIFRYGVCPAGTPTYREEDTRTLFTRGKAVFMRNWPYVWALSQDSAKGSLVAGKVGVAPLPHAKGHRGAGCLGGWNMMISRFSRHPKEAWKFVDFMTGEEGQRLNAIMGTHLPTRKKMYHDPGVLSKNPYFARFYDVFTGARPRPVTPFYSRISDIFQIRLHQAITGSKTPEEALKEAAEELRKMEGFK